MTDAKLFAVEPGFTEKYAPDTAGSAQVVWTLHLSLLSCGACHFIKSSSGKSMSPLILYEKPVMVLWVDVYSTDTLV